MRRFTAFVSLSVVLLGACADSGTRAQAPDQAASRTTALRRMSSTTQRPSSTTSRDTARSLSVSPTAGSASAETVLTVSGSGCRHGVIFWLTENGAELEGAQAATADADGNWKGTLNIDSTDAPSGSYAVIADCYAEPGRVEFRYAAVRVDVLP